MTENTEINDERVSLKEVSESITGWDELAIQKMFGFGLDENFEKHGMISVRAFVFIHLKRTGMKDQQAHKAAMDMSLQELKAGYLVEEDEVPNPMAGIEDGPGND